MKNTKIKGLMAEHGLTQRDLATFLGVSLVSINLKINGKSEFKTSELIILSQKFKTKIDDLVGNPNYELPKN